MNIKKSKWELVGYCAVDSGQIMIVDPCYVLPDGVGDKVTEDQYVYQNLIERGKRCNWKNTEEEIMFSGTNGTGVNLSGFGGDGNYPVYVKKDKNGLQLEVKIILNVEE